MSKKGFGFTDQWFKDRGYAPDGNGGWISPKFNNPIKRKTTNRTIGEMTQMMVDTGTISISSIDVIIPKEKVNNSPDFTHKLPTEWFISYNVPSKKNSRQNFVKNGRQISIPSKIHAQYVKATKMQYAVFGREFKKTVEELKLPYPLRIEFTFVRNSKRKFDYCNACQTCEDLMKDNGWIEDDSANHIIPVFAPYRYDKENSGVKIKILT